MATVLSFPVVALLFVAWYLIVIWIGVREGKSRKWPLGREATISSGALLIAQWVAFAVWIVRLPTEDSKILVARGAIPLLFGVPAVLLLFWGWFYLNVMQRGNASGDNA